MGKRMTRGIVLLVFLACFLARPEAGSAQTGEEDKAPLSLLPFTVEFGAERFDDFLLNRSEEDEDSRIDADSEVVPVIRVVTPTKFYCMGKEGRRTFHTWYEVEPGVKADFCYFGFGIRGIVGTRLVRGNWEPIVGDSETFFSPRFKYRQSPLGIEFVAGMFSDIRPMLTYELGWGANFYDLLIFQNDRKLLETSDIEMFLYHVVTVDLVGLIHWASRGEPGDLPWGLVLRVKRDLECGTDNCNVVDVSNLPGGDSAHKPILFRSESLLLVFSFWF